MLLVIMNSDEIQAGLKTLAGTLSFAMLVMKSNKVAGNWHELAEEIGFAMPEKDLLQKNFENF